MKSTRWLMSALAFALAAKATQTIVTVHSTSAAVRFYPETSCADGGCSKQYEPWVMKTYSHEGWRHSFFETWSEGNDAHSEQVRRMEFDFTGSSVSIYGAPRGHLLNYPSRWQNVCIDQECFWADAAEAYNRVPDPWQPVLVFRKDGLDPKSRHHLELRLGDESRGEHPWDPIRGMSFQFLQYTMLSSVPLPPYVPDKGFQLVDAVLYDGDYNVRYLPHPMQGWTRTFSLSLSDYVEGFRHSSSDDNLPSHRAQVEVDLSFIGSEICVYGASPEQLDAISQEAYEHARQEICVEGKCIPLDVNEAYLNIPTSKRHLPVPLWRGDGFDPFRQTSVSLRMVDERSPVGHVRRMSFRQAIYKEVTALSHWIHPLPNATYNHHIVSHSSLSFFPSYLFGFFSPWTDAVNYHETTDDIYQDERPGWSKVIKGYDVKVFAIYKGASDRPAIQEICADGDCHFVDVEYLFLNANVAEGTPVLIHQFKDLDPFAEHSISTRVTKHPDEFSYKYATISHLEYTEVVIDPQHRETPQPSPNPVPKPGSEHSSGPAARFLAIILFLVQLMKAVVTLVFLTSVVFFFVLLMVVADSAVKQWLRSREYSPLLHTTTHPADAEDLQPDYGSRSLQPRSDPGAHPPS